MVTSIRIHVLKRSPLATTLTKNPPSSIEEFSRMAKEFIRKEEMLEMKEDEGTDKGRILKPWYHTVKLPLGGYLKRYKASPQRRFCDLHPSQRDKGESFDGHWKIKSG
ncbi:UNVERIFIED_CONTAM: hypothetical protein Slati_1449500 [Sesamum latifolium]|uniref:Uncharacterized protein n=1 Tax=Sesamum latifolium TaxID=2727402 RepID=A0AAW2X9S1_9LAMI